MAKSVKDLATITPLLLTPGAREKLPEDGYMSFLRKDFEGLKVGFLDPAVWKFPPVLCESIMSVEQQMVSHRHASAVRKQEG